MTSKLETILVLALMIGIISGLSFASILLRAESAHGEVKSSDDNGGSKESKDDNSKSEEKQEETKSDEPDNSKNNDNEVKDDLPGDVIQATPDRDKLKGTPEEQEQAARDDWSYDDGPGKFKPYPTKQPKPNVNDDPNEYCDTSECYGPGSKDGADVNCLGKYCKGGTEPFKEGDYCKFNKWDTKKCGDDNKDKPCNGLDAHRCKDDGKEKEHWDGKCNHWWSNWNCHHGKHHHNHHDNHNHRDSKHTHTSTSGGHGDLDLVINIDHYNTKSSSKLKDFNLQIDVIQEDDSDNVYDKNLDLSKMPDKIKIDHLDIDKGDLFLTQLVNNDAEDGDSYLAVADENTVNIYLTGE